MSVESATDIAFFVMGVGIIIFVLARAGSLKRGPVAFTHEKWGTLNVDFVAFLVLAGIVVDSVGVFFRYRGYEAKLSELGGSQATMHGQIAGLQSQIDRFKSYDVNVALEFK